MACLKYVASKGPKLYTLHEVLNTVTFKKHTHNDKQTASKYSYCEVKQVKRKGPNELNSLGDMFPACFGTAHRDSIDD